MEKRIITIDELYQNPPISTSDLMRIYKTDDHKILKVFKEYDDISSVFKENVNHSIENGNNIYHDGCECAYDYVEKVRNITESKVLVADEFKLIKGVSLPECAYYDKAGKFIGFSQPLYYYMDLYQYLRRPQNKKELCEIILKVSSIIKQCNENGINIVDLGNYTNILVGPLLEVMLIDYDDFQIGDSISFMESATFWRDDTPILSHPKYYNEKKGLITTNFDKMAMTNMATYILFNEDIINSSSKESKELQLKALNGEKVDYTRIQPEFRDCVNLLFNLNKDNIYPDDAIKSYMKRL